jgi:hypothetical protein
MRGKVAAAERQAAVSGYAAVADGNARAESVGLGLLEILAEGPCPRAAQSLMKALTDGMGARYAAFFAADGDGWRMMFERGCRGGALLVPPELMARRRDDRVRVAAEQGRLWVGVNRGGACITALFDPKLHEEARAFARVGPAAAEFLTRSAAFGAESGGAQALLAAVSSIVHDTLNTMTGLSLCLTAYTEKRVSRREAKAEEALLDRGLATLELLCREYAGIDRASRARSGIADAQAMVRSYRDLLAESGISVRRIAAARGFSLSAARQGVALRALVHATAGMLQVGGSDVRLWGRTSRGVTSIGVAFKCRAAEAALCNEAIGEAAALVESRGGDVRLSARRTMVRMVMRFAEGAKER